MRNEGGPLAIAAALGTGALLTIMVQFNGALGAAAGPVFSSWAAHGTGTLAATALLLALRGRRRRAPAPEAVGAPRLRAPLWAYAGGLSGALTVIITSQAVNSGLGLAGTLALGLLGQVVFALLADRFGWFGLPSRRPDRRDGAALLLILSGSALIILFAGAEP
ncbi:DMT family transporter [Aureimonas sp. AU4]|uniref:DMT family transporter n=1 Tax=Aureimonas sp. AU4 TaxID=1638163 RepID=UPI000782D007|nr:DMT family transporter [Aureimonas sp. AU4]